MNTLYLCNVPEIGLNNLRQVDFANYTNQINFFHSKVKKIIEKTVAVDSTLSTLTLNEPLSSLYNVDYMYAYNGSKPFFFFVIDKQKRGENATILTLKCDVFQTYMWDYAILPSFIERCHVPRWVNPTTPTMEIVDEGLPLGTYINAGEPENIYKLNESYVMATTSPLGKLKGGTDNTIEGNGESDENNNVISLNIFDENGNEWMCPTTGTVTAGYPNYSDETYHGGWDIANSKGTPIYAIADGVVYSRTDVNDGSPYGNYLVISHTGNKDKVNYYFWYAHFNGFASGMAQGAIVTKGQLIGYMGTTGNSTGDHLHLEQRKPNYAYKKDNVNCGTNLYVGRIIKS